MSQPPTNRPRRPGQVFAVPAALFALSLFGLVASLLSEGWADVIFVLLAGSGLAAAFWTLSQRRS